MIYIFILMLIELCFVSYQDLKWKKIYNIWPALNVVFGISAYILFPATYILSWEILLIPGLFFVLGFILFLAGVMGAGDSKFIISLLLMIPVEYHLLFIENLLLATIFVGGAFFSYKIIEQRKFLLSFYYSRQWKKILTSLKSSFSFAPVILMAWIFLGLKEWL